MINYAYVRNEKFNVITVFLLLYFCIRLFESMHISHFIFYPFNLNVMFACAFIIVDNCVPVSVCYQVIIYCK